MALKPSKPSFWQMFLSVLAAFFGVQSSHNQKRDFQAGFSWQWALAGLVVTLAFIFFVMFMVSWVLSLAGA